MASATHWTRLALFLCALVLLGGCTTATTVDGSEVTSGVAVVESGSEQVGIAEESESPEIDAALSDGPATSDPATDEASLTEPDEPAEEPTTPAVTRSLDNEPDVEPAAIAELDAERPAAPNGRAAPAVETTPEALAIQLLAAEVGLQDPGSTAEERAAWGHLHQVVIRKVGYEPDLDSRFFEALPQQYVARTLLHVSARRALIDLKSGYDAADFIPAWQIVEPEPAASLLSYYREAESLTGIDWEYLAGINLVETGMGRIRGLSSAGAQGPMQFLPTTWEEAGIGEGDINDARDAINGAARYLVRRGGPEDMQGAIWGYNNSDDYVTAVRAYAELLRQDPTAYEAIYNWEIYFFTEAGDIWLPTGFRTDETLDLYDFLAANPWSSPDPNLR